MRDDTGYGYSVGKYLDQDMFVIYYGFQTWAICYDDGSLHSCYSEQRSAQEALGQMFCDAMAQDLAKA